MPKSPTVPSENSRTGTYPFAITFADGYYAVWQCRSADHARQRAQETYPDRVVVGVRLVD